MSVDPFDQAVWRTAVGAEISEYGLHPPPKSGHGYLFGCEGIVAAQVVRKPQLYLLVRQAGGQLLPMMGYISNGVVLRTGMRLPEDVLVELVKALPAPTSAETKKPAADPGDTTKTRPPAAAAKIAAPTPKPPLPDGAAVKIIAVAKQKEAEKKSRRPHKLPVARPPSKAKPDLSGLTI